MNGNLCRCATYSRIVGAVKRAAEIMKKGRRDMTEANHAKVHNIFDDPARISGPLRGHRRRHLHEHRRCRL